MKKLLILFSISFCCQLSYSQVKNEQKEINTWAVVIGISDYQDIDIPDLNYSDKDAQAFTAYLRSKAGGNLPSDHIRLLINKEATNGNIFSAIDWLHEASKNGDRIIFYFSGYGDEKFGPKERPSFVLPHDAPHSAFMTSLFPYVRYMNVLNKRTNIREQDLIVIMDSYILNHIKIDNLKNERRGLEVDALIPANEIMISQGKNNYSSNTADIILESRNTYSYLLLDGLTGMADNNQNFKIEPSEIENFIYRKIKKPKSVTSEFYLLTNQSSTPVSYVSSEVVNTARYHYQVDLPIVKMESLSVYNKIIKAADKSAQDLYQDFLIAINIGNLLEPKGNSANEYYEKLILEQSLEKMKNGLKRMLAAALQDEAQQAINSYLKMDPRELTNRWEHSKSYIKYSNYLDRAANLLGERHYLFERLISMKIYFIGISQRLTADANKSDRTAYETALITQKKALEYEAEAPFIFNEIGLLNSRLQNSDLAIENYTKAMNMAPGWGIPYNNIGAVFLSRNDSKNAIEWFKKAMKIYPEFSTPYYNMACTYAKGGKKHKSLKWLEKALAKGFLNEEKINQDADLENLRNMGKYKSLMKRYFPKSVDTYK